MVSYVNTHCILNSVRDNAIRVRQFGPRVLVCGGNLSGKTTLCKILINYALKSQFVPIFIDLDLFNNEIGPPGCLMASVVTQPLPTDLLPTAVGFFHGYEDPFV